MYSELGNLGALEEWTQYHEKMDLSELRSKLNINSKHHAYYLSKGKKHYEEIQDNRIREKIEEILDGTG